MLRDLDCKNAAGRAKAYKLSDSHGLYLYVTPKGYRSWRWNYRFRGKEKTMTLGSYPGLKLAEARNERAELDKIRRRGTDPSSERQQVRLIQADADGATFETVARQWHAKRIGLLSAKHASNIQSWLEREIFPQIGGLPISQIKAPIILATLKPIEERSAGRARRFGQFIDAVFQYAIAAGLTEHNPAARLRGALMTEPKGRQPALTKLEEAQALLLAAEAAPGHPLTKLASRLLAITAVRSGSLRHAEPHEFEDLDGDTPIWRIPASKLKLGVVEKQQEERELIVPLPPKAVEIVQLALRFSAGRYVFPNSRFPNKPMSENAVSVMYRRLPVFSGRHVPHGWRSTFSTIMNERATHPNDRKVIDLMLAHKPQGVEAAYNRADYDLRRREIAAEWADLLLGPLPPPSSFISGRRR